MDEGAATMSSNIAVPPTGRSPNGAEWDVFSVEDFATGILTFRGNKSITIHTSYYAHCQQDQFGCEILGTRAGAAWPELRITRPDGDDVTREVVQPDQEYQASVEELRHFSSLVRKTTCPIVPLEQSVVLVRMIEALYRSAGIGDVIRL